MSYKTIQELFDIAYVGLAKQGFQKSHKEDDQYTCLYRGPGGRKCAVGHLIPDSYAGEICEGPLHMLDSAVLEACGIESSIAVALNGSVTASIKDAYVNRFVVLLQQTHDNPYDNKIDAPLQLQEGLLRLAKSYGLTIPEIP